MIATDHTTLRLSGALNVEHLTALELRIGVNAHGWAIVEGEAGEDALAQLTGAVAGREQHILTIDESGMERCLFAGVIREASLVSVDGYSRFHVELLSGTCLMDREIRSRSFQDVSHTYSQVAEQICSEYNGGAAICTVGEDKTLGRPVIQYRETDWKFLMRLASHCGGVLVPETHRGLPRLWFGFPDRSFTCEFPEDSYTSGISQRYYELGGMAAGYDRADFFYYDVKSTQLCDLGWYTVFKGQSFIISEKYAVLERGELIFTYRLGRPGLGWGKMLYNEKISGMTLLGEVLETARETVKLKLDIDQDWNPGGPYPYTWRPETGNFMYCMPQVGTRISLYCPNYDEKEAIAVNCVRTNGDSCGRMSDPAKRSFVTEHGKEMNLYPEEMSLLGGSEGTVHLSDENGITISSQKPIFILGMSIRFEAPTFRITVPNSELLMAKYQYENQTPDSCYQMTNLFNVLAMNHTHMEGWNRVAYPAFQDAPVEGDFWGSLIGNVLAGLAVVGMVALTLATFGAAAPVVIGAIAVGSMAVIGKGVSDIMSGSVSSTEAYMSAGFWGAVAGAVSGGVGSLIEGAIPEGAALLTKMGIVGFSGMVETVIENTIQGQDTSLPELAFAFVLSAGLFGLGDNLSRAFKKWKSAANQADNAARALAGQADNVLDNVAGQVDNILDDVANQMDNVASDLANQTDNFIDDVTRRTDDFAEKVLDSTDQAKDLLNQGKQLPSPDMASSGTRFSSWDEMKDAYPRKVTQFVKDNKPPYSPDLKKWFKNGGSIEIDTIDGKQVWTYISSSGDAVPYVDGYIEFPEKYLHPTIEPVNIGGFTGDRGQDLSKLLDILEKEYGITEIPDGFIVHHHTENGVLQLVDERIHSLFSHVGGHSLFK